MEWKVQKKILESSINEERQNQKLIVESDKYENCKDEFINLVTEKITFFKRHRQRAEYCPAVIPDHDLVKFRYRICHAFSILSMFAPINSLYPCP